MMRLDFGIWDHFERRPGVDPARQYREKVALIRDAERLGFSHYHVAEHHLSPLDMAPSPSVFLAALAQATERIRIGAAVYCLPLYHPVRLVQELCMLDNIAGGRLDIGVGRGVRPVEHSWYGVPEEEVRPRFQEVLRILVKAMTEGRLDYQGRFYRFDNLPLDLLPVQRPHPPLWYAGGTEAAGRGGFCFVARGADDVERYWQLWEESRDQPGRVNTHLPAPTAGITKHVVVRHDLAEAQAIARRAWPVLEEHWFATAVPLTEDGQPVTFGGPRSDGQDFEEALRGGRRLLVGTPAMIRDAVAGWVRQFENRPAFHFSPAVQWGDISYDEARESLELLASEVMPAFQTAAAGAEQA